MYSLLYNLPVSRWAIHGTVHSVTICQYWTKFSICYLNANASTLVYIFFYNYVQIARSFKRNLVS